MEQWCPHRMTFKQGLSHLIDSGSASFEHGAVQSWEHSNCTVRNILQGGQGISPHFPTDIVEHVKVHEIGFV